MFNLSLTACSFILKETNSRGNDKIFNLNSPISVELEDGSEMQFAYAMELFPLFFEYYNALYKNDEKQQSFKCEFQRDYEDETDDFKLIYAHIFSGSYGSSSDIIDGDTEEIRYQKTPTDIDAHPFFFFVIIPKDNEKVSVQKGMLIFQNVGAFGIKTITTELMQKFFSSSFGITLKCSTIAPELFVKKVIRRDNIKKLVMVKNVKSADIADDIYKGYGTEVRELGHLGFTPAIWDRIMEKIRYVAGGKWNLFEFEQKDYDTLKVVVDIGGRKRKIDLHNLENLSIIEAIPDDIRMADGHPNKQLLIEHFKKVATEYLEEMTLQVQG